MGTRGWWVVLAGFIALGALFLWPSPAGRQADPERSAAASRGSSGAPAKVTNPAAPSKPESKPGVPTAPTAVGAPGAAEAPAVSAPPGWARFVGRVMTRDDRPIAGASVTLVKPGRPDPATTDADGGFAVEAPAPGVYRLTAAAAGFVASAPITLTATSEGMTQGIVVFLDALDPRSPDREPEDSGALPIGGRVIDADDQPVQGATVYARSPFSRTLTARSGADGAFTTPDIAGRTTLHAVAGDRVSKQVQTTPGSEQVVLKVESVGGFIAGQVSTPKGGPARQFHVALLQAIGRLEERLLDRVGFVTPKGDYRIGPLPPGAYRVRAEAPDAARSVTKPADVSAATTVTVDLQLRAGASLSGTVIAAETRVPVAGARVRLESPFTHTPPRAVTDGEGRFVLTRLPPGLFSVEVSSDGFHRRLVTGLKAVEGLAGGPIEVVLNPLASPDEEPQAQLAGIGAALRPEGDALIVDAVLDKSGAAEAGLMAGDRIMTIDGRAVAELDFNGVLQLIRGPEGTTVLLTLQRAGQTLTFNVPRRAISQ